MFSRGTFAMGAMLLFSSISAVAQKAEGQNDKPTCAATIDQPKQGENVGSDGQISGHITIPPGTFAWILARKRDINGFWPQANGAIQVEPDGSFRGFVTYGKDGDKGPFEIAIAIVDDGVNQALNRWVDRANETQTYPPIRFPNVHQGCPVTRVVVTRQ
jgi:hypothetical protein